MLELLPLMANEDERPYVLLETARLTNEIRNLTKDKLFEIKTIQGIIGQEALGLEDFKKLIKVIKVEDYGAFNKLMEHKHYFDLEDARKEARAEGRAEERESILSDLISAKEYLKKGYSIEKVSLLTSIDKETLLKIF